MTRKKALWLLPPLMAALAFFIFTSNYYRADETALAALRSSDRVAVERTGYGWRFDGPSQADALVFYPGAKVEAAAYAPMMHALAASGVDACLVEMPFRLAFFDIRAARRVMEQHDYAHWYIGGHSLGGMLAAHYAADHPEGLDGVVLCAAYPITALPDSLTEISVYGTRDQVLDLPRLEAGRDLAPPRFVEHVIQGGNHAGFGNYGHQKGDGAATVSAEAQQAEAVGVMIGAMLAAPGVGA